VAAVFGAGASGVDAVDVFSGGVDAVCDVVGVGIDDIAVGVGVADGEDVDVDVHVEDSAGGIGAVGGSDGSGRHTRIQFVETVVNCGDD
jgi:hypothetical protein